jgi:hypothetical protein
VTIRDREAMVVCRHAGGILGFCDRLPCDQFGWMELAGETPIEVLTGRDGKSGWMVYRIDMLEARRLPRFRRGCAA